MRALLQPISGINVVPLIVLVFLVIRRRKIKPEDISSAICDASARSGLSGTIGESKAYAEGIRNDHRSLEQLLPAPTERGPLAEMALEEALHN